MKDSYLLFAKFPGSWIDIVQKQDENFTVNLSILEKTVPLNTVQ